MRALIGGIVAPVDVIGWNQVLEHPHQLQRSGEASDIGRVVDLDRPAEAIVFAAHYVYEEIHCHGVAPGALALSGR